MIFLKQKLNGILKRIRCYSYGIFYLRNADFKISDTLKINKKIEHFKFINLESEAFQYEFTEICLNDCYQLNLINKWKKDIKTIVDVGVNQGLFSIAARQHFPTAILHGYEPNQQLREILLHNSQKLNSMFFYEAVIMVLAV